MGASQASAQKKMGHENKKQINANRITARTESLFSMVSPSPWRKYGIVNYPMAGEIRNGTIVRQLSIPPPCRRA
jgi:hypothetical protein